MVGMDWTVDKNAALTLLLQYSEWLDSIGLMVTEGNPDEDLETHSDLVERFVRDRDVRARPKVLT
jgi:hypothetical protein